MIDVRKDKETHQKSDEAEVEKPADDQRLLHQLMKNQLRLEEQLEYYQQKLEKKQAALEKKQAAPEQKVKPSRSAARQPERVLLPRLPRAAEREPLDENAAATKIAAAYRGHNDRCAVAVRRQFERVEAEERQRAAERLLLLEEGTPPTSELDEFEFSSLGGNVTSESEPLSPRDSVRSGSDELRIGMEERRRDNE